MSRRLLGGVAGWLLAMAPLLAVDAVGYFGIASSPDPFVVGAVAVVIGLLLGGMTAGLIGGRSHQAGGGTVEAALAGIVAATLYTVSIVGLLEVARASDALPPTITEYPIQTSVGILFLAALLVLVALVTGIFAGRTAEESAGSATTNIRAPMRSQSPGSPQAPRIPSGNRPGGTAYGLPPYAQPRFGDAAPPSRPMGPRLGGMGMQGMQEQSPDASDPRYAGARVYGPQARPARGPESNPNRR